MCVYTYIYMYEFMYVFVCICVCMTERDCMYDRQRFTNLCFNKPFFKIGMNYSYKKYIYMFK